MKEQLEPDLWKQTHWNPNKPWKIQKTMWRKAYKTVKVRAERHRAKQDPECQPLYRQFYGDIL